MKKILCLLILGTFLLCGSELTPSVWGKNGPDPAEVSDSGNSVKAQRMLLKILAQANELQKQGKVDKARTLLEKSLEAVPNEPRLVSALALLEAQEKNLDTALALIDGALEEWEGNAALLAVKARVIAKAEAADADVRADLRQQLLDMETYVEKMTAKEKSVFFSQAAAAWVQLEVWEAEDAPDSGIKSFFDRTRDFPEVFSWAQSKILELVQTRKTEAVRCARRIIDETKPDDWNWFGSIAVKAKDFPTAETAFRKLTELNPADPDGWTGLLQALKVQSKPVAQDEFLAQIVASVPPKDQPLCLGKAWMLLGDAKRSERVFLDALEQEPEDLQLLQALCQLYLCTNHPEITLPYLDRMTEGIRKNRQLSNQVKLMQLEWIRSARRKIESAQP